LGCVRCTVRAGDGDTREDGIGRGGVFGMAGKEGLATNCISCCSCTVRAAVAARSELL